MNIIHLGGEKTVTGSCHLLQTNGINIMVDCGLAQGSDAVLPMKSWPVSPGSIDYLFLTHAHIDHIGRVPDLIEAGFDGEIICTPATKALLIPMLRDALSFTGRSKRQALDLEKGIEFKLGNAGHILGSCFVRFKFPLKAGGDYTVIFSGDLGCSNTPILPDPDRPDSCDLLVLESTYGDRNHEGRKSRIEALRNILDRAFNDGGIVYIPAFSLGRTQELIYELDRSGTKVTVFIDSPLGLEITKIYSSLDSFWDKEAKDLKAKGDHPLDFRNLYSVERFRDHKKLLQMDGPAIIIAGSGMCTGGRILDHLRHGLDDPKNDIFFVGYQAKGTLGFKKENIVLREKLMAEDRGQRAEGLKDSAEDWVLSEGNVVRGLKRGAGHVTFR
ncbi:MAG: MBL fold metallo-hydrolase [Pseudorhodobacter sp.]|nr:MBL fold metallo-hydrolase [Pseudorhodobacter sp.]